MPVHRRLLKFGEDMAGQMVVRHFRTSVEGKVNLSEVELEYERRLRAMSPAEKMARSAAMFAGPRPPNGVSLTCSTRYSWNPMKFVEH